jgi:hypothetical protein
MRAQLIREEFALIDLLVSHHFDFKPKFLIDSRACLVTLASFLSVILSASY